MKVNYINLIPIKTLTYSGGPHLITPAFHAHPIPAETITTISPSLIFPSLSPYSIEIIPSFCPL